MPRAQDTYRIILKPSHVGWGDFRYTNTRRKRKGEAYIHIPKHIATSYNIYNSNQTNANVIYKCTSLDGFLKSVDVRASGSTKKGNIYAKQFQGSGNLKLFGYWFKHVNASVGDVVVIKFTSSTSFNIKLIKRKVPNQNYAISQKSTEE